MARTGLAELRSFGRQFWLVNSIEMLERGAYYGMVSILVFHFVNQRGFDTGLVGALNGVLQFLLYFVPLFAAALAEKYGYRPGMVAAFTIAFAGYLALALTGALQPLLGQFSLIPGMVLLGIGAGTFKPIAAAAIARATSEEQRNLGFTIYYAGVNVGGFLGPLLIGLLVPEASYGLVFYGAAALIALNLVISLLVYRNPVEPRKDKSLADALRALGELRKDRLYLLLLLFYAGFWFMYAQQQFFLGKYAADFGVLPPGFNVALIAIINPATIIIFGPILGKLTNRLPSLPIVVTGTLLYIIGYAAVALLVSPYPFVLGVVLFSVGEVMVQPSFLSYTSKVAPQDKVAVYLGYSFLPIGVGLPLGSAVGGVLYHHYAEVLHTPAAYWTITALAGVFSMSGILLLNRIISKRRSDPSGELSPKAKRIVHSRAAPLAVLLLVPVLLLAAVAPAQVPYQGQGIGADVPTGSLVDTKLPPLTGNTQEGQSTTQMVHIRDARAQNLTFTLHWTDEAPAVPAATNQPDTFQLTVTSPDGTKYVSEPSASGSLEFRVPTRAAAADGAYNVTVALLDAGDVVLGPAPLTPDTGNAWTLDVAYRAPGA